MKPNTHLGINADLVGRIVSLAPQEAIVKLTTTAQMAVDDHGLVHGGFVFGLADYAAMLAVNDPNVVLGAVEARFLAPTKAGDVVIATAHVEQEKGRKRVVKCEAVVGDTTIFTATFTTFVLDEHVLTSR